MKFFILFLFFELIELEYFFKKIILKELSNLICYQHFFKKIIIEFKIKIKNQFYNCLQGLKMSSRKEGKRPISKKMGK